MSIDSAKKPKKGRPPVDSEAVNVRLPRDMLDAVDAFRRNEDDLPTRPEAIRRLVEKALTEMAQ
jgi:metal-responsive CopG/Arc/MetJ family transcriptional regulator